MWLRPRWYGRSVRRAVAWLAGMCVLQTLVMWFLEGMSPEDALWMTVVTVTTVGYGDIVPHTAAGRLATLVFLLVGCVPVFAKMASDWFDWRETVRSRQRRGKWRWKMKDHILVVGTPSAEANRFFKAIARQFRGIPEWADVPIHLVTRAFDSFPDGLPDGLRALDVVHSSGAPTDPDALIAADAGKARAVIVLADREDDPLWDAVTIDVASRIVEMARLEGSPAPTLVVECVEDRNRHRMLAAGATSAVRPLRTYPEMLVRAVVAPGSEHLLESLFRSEGDDLHRIDLGTVWRGRWSDLACPLLQRNVGTAIACMAPGGAITINPAGDRPIDVAAIFIVVRDMRRTLCTEVSAIVGVPVRLSE